MSNRILDLSVSPARLSAANGLLLVECYDRESLTIPFTHLAAVVCSHPQVTFTQAVLSELAAANASLITCDRKHLPIAMLLPLVSHSTQTTKFLVQAAAPQPLRKRLWREIVIADGRQLELPASDN